jgi:hypothetical protein
MTGPRRGAVIAATWLIGVGVVFLVREAMSWTWNEAWPSFVILAAVAWFVGLAMPERPGRSRGLIRVWGLTWPVVWLVVGSVLLAATTGAIPLGPGELVDAYWPWAVIVLGLWFLVGAILPVRDVPEESLALPLANRTEAAIDVKFGAGDLAIGRGKPGELLGGSFRGGVVWRELAPGRIVLEQDVEHGLPWLDHDATWSVGLTDAIPLDLRLDTGACRSELDLTDLRVRTLELHTGASRTDVRLPRAAGLTRVRVQAGAAEVVLEVPTGVAARIRGQVALGSLAIDERRFPMRVDGEYASPDEATAPNRVEIDVQSGLGAVRVVGATGLAIAA